MQKDSVGNIYIIRQDRDPDLSGIALTFSLDRPLSNSSFSAASRTFLDLEQSKTSCDVTLLGWSSPDGRTIGHDVWEGTCAATAGYELAPELREFSGLEDVSSFSLSAIIEVIDTSSDSLVVRGGPVLTEATRRVAHKSVKVETGGPPWRRIPVLSI